MGELERFSALTLKDVQGEAHEDEQDFLYSDPEAWRLELLKLLRENDSVLASLHAKNPNTQKRRAICIKFKNDILLRLTEAKTAFKKQNIDENTEDGEFLGYRDFARLILNELQAIRKLLEEES